MAAMVGKFGLVGPRSGGVVSAAVAAVGLLQPEEEAVWWSWLQQWPSGSQFPWHQQGVGSPSCRVMAAAVLSTAVRAGTPAASGASLVGSR